MTYCTLAAVATIIFSEGAEHPPKSIQSKKTVQREFISQFKGKRSLKHPLAKLS
jgi:hypothetical protein